LSVPFLSISKAGNYQQQRLWVVS